ncbi:Proteasome activator pa28 N-terminal domain [Trinorchestia longiramus]|nr:Proteasome activator pa28 N-terminal domain [Trinorchestia longiramus]
MSSNSVSSVQKVEDYKSSVIKKAEEIVRNKFPDHILRFNELLEQAPFKCDDLSKVHSELHIPVPLPHSSIHSNSTDGSERSAKKRCREEDTEEVEVSGCKVYVLPLGAVPINSTITSMVDTIKPFIRDLVEEANLVGG